MLNNNPQLGADFLERRPMATTSPVRFNKLILAIAAVILLAGIYVILPAKYHFGYKAPQTTAQAPVTEVTYQGIDGQNALQILEATHKVDVKHYSFGDMVTGIDGTTPDSAHTWSFYVNGQLAQVGAGDYVTKSTDTIDWKVTSIN